MSFKILRQTLLHLAVSRQKDIQLRTDELGEVVLSYTDPAIGVSCSKFFCSFGYEYLGGIEEFRGDIGMGGSGWISNGFATHGLRLTLGVNFR